MVEVGGNEDGAAVPVVAELMLDPEERDDWDEAVGECNEFVDHPFSQKEFYSVFVSAQGMFRELLDQEAFLVRSFAETFLRF